MARQGTGLGLANNLRILLIDEPFGAFGALDYPTRELQQGIWVPNSLDILPAVNSEDSYCATHELPLANAGADQTVNPSAG